MVTKPEIFAQWLGLIVVILGLSCVLNFNHTHSNHIKSSYYTVSMRKQLQYTSQIKPVDIPGGCEAASLKMALSIRGQARNVSLNRLIHQIGWYTGNHGNPNLKYSNNPYKSGNEATMYPPLLCTWARKYHTHAEIINFANQAVIRRCLVHHDPVIAEAGHDMQAHWYDDHILCLLGYKHTRHGDYVQYADSLSVKPDVHWARWWNFNQAYWRPKITGCRAVVLY